jgi:hypothetical protein
MNEKVAAPVKKSEINGRGDPLRWPRGTLYPQKVGTIFADKRRLLGRYSFSCGLKATEFSLLRYL